MSPTVRRAHLTQPLGAKLALGHPWIFADAVRLEGRGARAGEEVELLDQEGAFVGRGVCEPDSPLRVRLWTHDRAQRVDDALLEARLRAARRRRPFPRPETSGFRLLHGEGDRAPGLAIDVYGEAAVLRPDGLAAERWIEPAREVASRLLPSIERWAVRRSSIYAAPDRPAAAWMLGSEGPNEVEFTEGGARYRADLIDGQKTGFFFDQRANRARIARLAPGRRVLNLFGYTGAFSVACALAGAARTTTVDLAAPAIDAARTHFVLNGLEPAAHAFEVADAYDYLDALAEARAPFDVAICDPPSFAHKRKDVARATAAYIRLFGSLLKALPDGAAVALCSCSSQIGRRAFLKICAEAASQAGVSLVLAGVYGADLDHPTLPGFPEGDYLQCAIGYLARS